MKKIGVLALLVLVSACGSEVFERDAIRATVVLDPAVKATCVLLEVRDPANKSVLGKLWLPRAASANELRAAIFKASLPESVELAARPYLDGNCENKTEAQTPNGNFVTDTASFVKGKVVEADPLSLQPGTDGDGDGYVGTGAGGADCNDGAAVVKPGAAESCSDQTDLNCDAKRGCEATACGPQACFGPPASIALTLPAGTVTAGTCTSGGMVQVKDAAGINSRVGANTAIGLTVAPASSLTFYTDAACTTAVTSVTIASGTGSAPFFIKAQVTGTLTVTAAFPGLASDTQSVTVVPGQGNLLVFRSPPRTATAAACSQVVQLQSQDAQGNAKPVSAATVISLAATPNTGFTFYSDSSCNTVVSSVTLNAGASDASFYFKGTKSGTVTVTVTAPGLTGSSQDETINPGPPAAIVFGPPQTVQAGNCSTPISVELRDAQGNTITVGASTQINLAASGVAVTLSNNSGCTGTVTNVTIPANSSSATFFVRGNVAGNATITGSLPGVPGVPNAMVVVTIAPGPATVVAFTTPAQSVQAGTCSTVRTVQLRDALANPVNVGADTAVNLSAAPPDGFQFFTQAGCGGTAVTSVTIPTGSSSASFFFRTTRAGSPVLTAATSSLSGTQTETITPVAPTVLAFPQSPLTVVAGVCTPVTLQAQDIHGNASPVSGNQGVTLAANPSAGFTLYSNSGCSTTTTSVTILSTQSSATFYVTGTVTGSVTVSATRGGFTTGNLVTTVEPGPANRIGFSTTAQTVEVGACSGLTTVQVRDAFSNATPVAANTDITLTGSTANITFYANANCTGPVTFVTVPAGQSSASFYFKDTVVENVTITAASGSLISGAQQQTITPLQPTALAFITAVQSVQANSCSGIVRVEAQALGAPTTVSSNTLVSLTANPSAGFTFYTNASCTGAVTEVTIQTGQSNVAFYFKATKAGQVTLTAASAGLTSATQTNTITPAAAAKIAFATPSRTAQAGVCSAIVTIQALDTFDNPTTVTGTLTIALAATAGDGNFKFFTDASCSMPASGTTSVSIPAGQGSVSFYFRGQLARSLTVTANPSSFSTITQSQTVTGGTATSLIFPASTPTDAVLAGSCISRTVESRDAFGNASLDGLTATLAASAQTEFFSDSACTTPATQITIAAGSSSTDFYFKAVSGGINATTLLDLTVSSGALNPATRSETIIPTARTGSCTIAANATMGNCIINPALASTDKTFLVFQATTPNTTGANANVRCFLNSTSQVRCERGASFASGAVVNIEWGVAEFPTIAGVPGVSVQRNAIACSNTTTNVAVSPAVVRENSFLLLSSRRNIGDQSSAVFRVAELTSTTQAQMRKLVDCADTDNAHLQVVEYPGTSVQRGVTSLANGSVSTQATLANSVTLSRSILLYSYLSDATGPAACNRALRGELTNGASRVTFSRGDGNNANCVGSLLSEISWEVVQFPVGTVVQQVTRQLTAGTLEANITISSVDRSRTLVVAGGQWASGQVHGEGKHATGEAISDMRVRASLVDNTTLRLTRETANDTATFTVYVVQLKP